MNERIKRMKEQLKISKYPLCIEKFRIASKILAETKNEPHIIRRAKILASILENITIFIEADDLFVGAGASKPFGMEIDYEYGAWSQDEIDALKVEKYFITPDDEAELQELNKKFGDKNLISEMGKVFFNDERLWPFMKSGLILPPWKGEKIGSGGGYAQSGLGLGPGFFLMGVDYSRILNDGSLKIIKEAEEELNKLRYFSCDSLEKANFLKSVIIVHKAFIKFANRYAHLAEEMAYKEKDPLRKKEYLKIASTCRRVPANSARNFFEALQSFWFVFLLITPSPTAAGCRFDQFMYPFYKKDITEGIITEAEVLELLACLRIKDMKINRVSGVQNRKKNSGMAKWHNWTIGGVNRDGKDASNELSYLLLEAAKKTQIPHHTLTLRVHENTPEKLIIKALEVVKTGLGMPAFISDKAYIEFFLRKGISLKDSREYVMTGCLDGNIPGLSRSVAVPMFIVPLALEIFMNNGINVNNGEMVGTKTEDVTKLKTFTEFKKAFYKQLKYLLSLAIEKSNIELITQRKLFPDPFRSSLMKEALKVGKDVLSRRMPLENAVILCPIGTINVADSLAAVKKLVYDDKKYSIKQLKTALEANWEGYENMQKEFLAAPKYGNDDDYVDMIAADLYSYIAKTLEKMDTSFGGKVVPTAISITSHQPGGALTGATPDGRCRGEILADGSMSPMHGMDNEGPLAVLKSAMKIDQVTYQATLLNMKFHPSLMKSESDMKKLGSMIRTYLNNGGKHIQFNIVDKEILDEAQKNPKVHKDLVVRVAGYSAYYTQLGKEIQDEIKDRTEFYQI